MQKRHEELVYSAAGLVVVFLILVLLNVVVGTFRARLDLTQGKLYTLSDATRAILAHLPGTVTLRLYFTQGDSTPLPIKAYGRRVEDMLEEFRQAAHGRLVIEKLDPEPDSDAEDSATLDGIDPQVTPEGDKFYLGVSVSYAGRKVALATLAADRERLLEYDLARAISRATEKHKPVIGVMTSLPLFGMAPNPMTGGQALAPAVFVDELKANYTVKRIAMDAERIDDDVKVLLVIHPRDVSDRAQFAIDQYLLRGGKVIAFLDPSAYFDQMPGPLAAMGGTQSNLDKLLKAWGIGYDPNKVVADMRYLTGSGTRTLPTLLSLNDTAFNPDDVVTAQLGSLLLPFAGAFTGKPAPGLSETVLVSSSPYSMLVDSFSATAQGEAALRGFKPSGVRYPLAIRLAGKFKTAFPSGRPEEKPAEKKSASEKTGTTAEVSQKGAMPAPEPLKESKVDSAVVLVGDSDFINDDAAVQVQQIFGQRIVVPSNGNLAFAEALVDQFAGDPELIRLRSRASASRPFTVIRDMEARAQEAWLGKLKELQDSLDQTQDKLNELQKGKAPGQATILTAAQQQELENFRRKAAETRRELKEVRRRLRADTDALEFWTKVINIALMPALVALAGIVIAIARRRRTPTI